MNLGLVDESRLSQNPIGRGNTSGPSISKVR
jgi:hypothetical protein